MHTETPRPQEDLARLPDYNFDHPDAFDTAAMMECIQELRAGRAADMPQYDFLLHKRIAATRKVRVQRWVAWKAPFGGVGWTGLQLLKLVECKLHFAGHSSPSTFHTP